MKLSKLITYKYMVNNLSVNHVRDELESLLNRVSTDLNQQNIDFDNLKEKIEHDRELIMATLDIINNNLSTFKQQLNNFVKGIEGPYYQKSRDYYQEGLKDSADYILDRYSFKKLLYENESYEFFLSRVKLHTNWKWPALEIRPAMCDITESLVGCDPLYLVDTHEDLFKVTKTKWTPEYQRRLRYYIINEQSAKLFTQLPQMQFGLIVAVDFLNFRPLEMIQRYMKEMFDLLRPGGTAIFTYNNCDYPIGVDNFENAYYCYTPGKKVKEICEAAGFKVAASFDLENNVSWLEIERPGRRQSIRGAQTLGQVLDI